jgi:hypothetical protein
MLLVKTDSLGSTGCDEVSITGNIEKNLTGVLLQRTTQPLSQNKGKEHTVNIKVDAAAQVEKAICFTEGIEDPGMENAEFSVFPNPANDYLNIQFNISDFRPQTSDFLIQIYDITGKLVKQMSTDNELLKTIDISGLNKGLYFISLINKDKIINAKFIKE